VVPEASVDAHNCVPEGGKGGALVDTRVCLAYLHDLQKEEKEAKEKEKAEVCSS
jgi:hypothetical protein